jgi:outer membrane protein assembly factor BamB
LGAQTWCFGASWRRPPLTSRLHLQPSASSFSACLCYQGLLWGHGYPTHGGKHRFFCLDAADGSRLWEQEDKEEHQWLLGCDGKVVRLGETGALPLADANARNGYRELARANVIDKTWACPALADGRLYIRSGTQLVCLDLR